MPQQEKNVYVVLTITIVIFIPASEILRTVLSQTVAILYNLKLKLSYLNNNLFAIIEYQKR